MRKQIALFLTASVALSLGACTGDGRLTNDSIHVGECLLSRERQMTGVLSDDQLAAENTLSSCYREGRLNARAFTHGRRIIYGANFEQPSRFYNCLVNVNVARYRGLNENYVRRCARFFREP